MRVYKVIWSAVLLAGALAGQAFGDTFPPGITAYTADSYFVRDTLGSTNGDYSGPVNNHHITVTPTDVSGEYDICLVFSEAASNGNNCEAYFAAKPSSVHGAGSFSVEEMNSMSIPWPLTGETYKTRCPALASDDNGNVHVTVRRVKYGNQANSYTALATKNAGGTWSAEKIYGSAPCGDWTQTVTAQGTIASSRNGAWLGFSSHYYRYPRPIYGGQKSWLSRIFGYVYDNASGTPGGDWDKIMLGGYDHTATGYWGSACAVSENGNGIIAGYVYAFDRFPLAGYDAGSGLNFGVGTDQRDTWEFARCPFENANCPSYDEFSFAPYVEETVAGDLAHFVWVDTSKQPHYAGYVFGTDPP
ncbi:MAG TPA: hypothetical protein VMW93_08100, partial [bacterium]|nr:hypothetical protein [bacterium]